MKNTMMVLVVLASLTFAGCKLTPDNNGGYAVAVMQSDGTFGEPSFLTSLDGWGLCESLANAVVDGKNYTFIRQSKGPFKGRVLIYKTPKLLPPLFKVIGGTVYAAERDKEGRETLRQQ